MLRDVRSPIAMPADSTAARSRERASARRAHPDRDAGLIAALVGRAGTSALARWRWLDAGNPHGRALVYLAGERDADAPSALVALVPRPIRMGDTTVAGAALGALLGPREPVSAALRQAAIELGRDELELVFGLPQPAHRWALAAAGAVPTATVRRFVLPRSLARLGRARRPWRQRRRVSVQAADPSHAERIDALTGAVPAQLNTPCASAALLAWRYANEPGCPRELLVATEAGRATAVMALRRTGEHAVWLDTLLCAPGGERAAVDAALAAAGDASVEVALSPSRPLFRALLARGFVPREARELYLLAAPANPRRSSLLDPEPWTLWSADAALTLR
jgi:hypothetical protein